MREAWGLSSVTPISTVQTSVLQQHLLKDNGIPQLQPRAESRPLLRIQSLCKLRDSVWLVVTQSWDKECAAVASDLRV